MGFRRLAVPWDTQPQEVFELNPECSFIRGATEVWIGSRPSRTLVRAKPGVMGGNAVLDNSVAGRVVTTSSGVGVVSGIDIGDPDELLPATECTIAVFRRAKDTTARVSSLFGYDGGASDRAQCHAPFSDGNIYWDFGNSTSGAGGGRVSTSYTKDTKPETLVFTAGASVGREIWRRGVRIASDTSANATRSATSLTQFIVGGVSGTGVSGSDNTETYMLIILPRVLSAQEIRQFEDDPWSAIAPRIATLPVAAGSNFTYTGSGGLQFGGAATTAYTGNFSATGAGGLQFGGTASTAFTAAYSAVGSGGLQFGGAAGATFDTGYAYTGSGGLQFGGSATTTYTAAFAVTGAGGLQFGGTAATSYTANYAATGSGGITFGGSAAASFDTGFSVTGSGGIAFGGAAAAQVGSANYLATGSGGLNLGGAAAVEFTPFGVIVASSGGGGGGGSRRRRLDAMRERDAQARNNQIIQAIVAMVISGALDEIA